MPGATALLGGFFTVGLPDLPVASGSAYYEITLLRLGDVPQVGWVPSGWAAEDGCGVGDDEFEPRLRRRTAQGLVGRRKP